MVKVKGQRSRVRSRSKVDLTLDLLTLDLLTFDLDPGMTLQPPEPLCSKLWDEGVLLLPMNVLKYDLINPVTDYNQNSSL